MGAHRESDRDELGTEEEQRRWRRVQSLFHRARELDADRRAEFLERHCAGNEGLREEIGELLAEALSTDSIDPDEATPAPAGRTRREDLSGRRLGDYELVRLVGEGSMGVIYEALQRSVQRSVALKILRLREEVLREGGSPEAYDRMAARFVDEAEVLGRLDHPGIVPIHELAHDRTLGSGDGNGEGTVRSWFTMRLVQGEDFRGIIDRVHRGERGWTLQRALQVVVRVCETMAFAHERGVLHRDLKPSHVMVGAFGEVYLLDWGLAKLTSRPERKDIRIRDADAGGPEDPPPEPAATPPSADVPEPMAPLRTIDGDVIGTPAYMPPEQAAGRLEKVGVRSDVYAVGALLYHLLAGQVPHLRPGERSAAPRELLRRVRTGPPTALEVCNPHVPAALAAVCEKAMARSSEDRYPSMEALADDLRAFLENRVVTAHRTGVLVELGKWVQRNRALSLALCVVAAVLLSWTASVLFLQHAANARLTAKNVELAAANTRAGEERDAAREQAAIATAISAFLDGMLRSIDPVQAQGEDVTVRDALDAAARRLDGAFPDQPEVEASVRTTVGVTYRQLGLLEEAEPHLLRALETRRRLHGDEAPETLLSLEEYALLLGDQGRLEEAEGLMREALDGRRRTAGPEARETLRTMSHLGQILLDAQRLDEAETLAREALRLQEEHLGPEDQDVIVSLEVLASVCYRRGELEEAERLLRRQYEANRRQHGDDHSDTLLSAINLVTILDALGRGDEARAIGEDFLQRVTAIFGPRHRNTLVVSANLALLLCNQGRLDEGVARFRETLALEREVFGSDHPETMLTLFNLTEVLRRAGRSAECVPLFTELLAWQREHVPPEHLDYRDTLWGLSDVLRVTGDPAAAVPLLEELLEIELRVSGPEHVKTQAVESMLAKCRELGQG